MNISSSSLIELWLIVNDFRTGIVSACGKYGMSSTKSLTINNRAASFIESHLIVNDFQIGIEPNSCLKHET